MRNLLLALALACLTAACADAPTEAPRTAAPEAARTSTTGTFGVEIVLEKMADATSPNWYFIAPLKNASSTDKFDYYYEWSTPLGVVLSEGWGYHTYTVAAGQTGEVNLVVSVTGPDGFAQAYGDWGPYPVEPPYGGGSCNLGWC